MSINLIERERIVLDIVEEYLNKNRTFNFNKILPFIISRFKGADVNINNNGIEEILKSLIEKRVLLNGSKLTRESLLLNHKRKKIYDNIVENPGIHFTQIRRNLNMPSHVVIWHIKFLERFNFILRDTFNNREIFFESSLDVVDVKTHIIISHEKCKKIFKYLKRNNIGHTRTHLSQTLNIHATTVNKYIELMEHVNLIKKEKISGKTLYFLSETYSRSKYNS